MHDTDELIPREQMEGIADAHEHIWGYKNGPSGQRWVWGYLWLIRMSDDNGNPTEDTIETLLRIKDSDAGKNILKFIARWYDSLEQPTWRQVYDFLQYPENIYDDPDLEVKKLAYMVKYSHPDLF